MRRRDAQRNSAAGATGAGSRAEPGTRSTHTAEESCSRVRGSPCRIRGRSAASPAGAGSRPGVATRPSRSPPRPLRGRLSGPNRGHGAGGERGGNGSWRCIVADRTAMPMSGVVEFLNPHAPSTGTRLRGSGHPTSLSACRRRRPARQQAETLPPPEVFTREILPRLQGVSVRAMAKATRLTRGYYSMIRRGVYVPPAALRFVAEAVAAQLTNSITSAGRPAYSWDLLLRHAP